MEDTGEPVCCFTCWLSILMFSSCRLAGRRALADTYVLRATPLIATLGNLEAVGATASRLAAARARCAALCIAFAVTLDLLGANNR